MWHSTSTSPSNSSSGSNGSGGLFGQNPLGNGSGSSPSSSAIASIAGKVSPGLVDIDTDLSYQDGAAAGTGIVVSSSGIVLTNNHVITGATQIRATDIGNGHTYAATVVGYDRSHDIAILQLAQASGLKTVTFADSSKISVGDGVVGLGNAGGVGGQPSTAGGAVVALNQSITASDESDGSSEQLAGLIEVNANIKPGDSGGALANTKGQVIGVDTAASAVFSFQASGGQGFAIPIDQAMTIAHQIQSGQATADVHIGPTAFLGVLINAKPTGTSQSGATLAEVVPGKAAALAGLVAGDTITAVAGQAIASPSALTSLVLRYHPGDKVRVDWVDAAGQSHHGTLTLTPGPAQ